jgi:hypothetical protein
MLTEIKKKKKLKKKLKKKRNWKWKWIVHTLRKPLSDITRAAME